MEELLKKVIEKITPDDDETAQLLSFFEELKVKLRGIGEVKLMGSVAKDTHLKGNKEIDVFIIIPPKKDLSGAVKEAEQALGKSNEYTIEKAFAKHPYIRVWKGDLRADVVPSYHIEKGKEPLSAVDRTQWHVEHVNANLAEGKRADVRLLKQFFKSVGVYGAEIRVGGFSGYACELLIMKFGSFQRVLEELSAVKRGTVWFLDSLPGKTFDEPLIFVDPVDKKRNVLSPLRPETLTTAILASRAFLMKPDEKWFFFSGEEGPKVPTVGLFFKSPQIVEDVRIGGLRRWTRKLATYLKENGFDVLEWRVDVDDGEDVVALFLEDLTLPKAEKRLGPSVFKDKMVEAFLEKNEGFYLDGERLIAVRQRRYTDAFKAVEDFIKVELPKGYKAPRVERNVGKSIKKCCAIRQYIKKYLFLR